MRSSHFTLAGFLAVLLTTTSVLTTSAPAETKKGTPKAASKAAPKGPAGETVRYFQFTGELLGDLPLDGFIKEVRQGNRVVSAVLDVCHWTTKADPSKDRFVIPLKMDGGRLVGQGQSQEKQTPVSVSLSRKQTGQTVAFSGTIARGGEEIVVNSSDNEDMTEADFLDELKSEDAIEASPRDFTELSPGSVGVKIKRESLAPLMKQLKGLGVEIMFESLAADCLSLRSGHQIVHLDVDPERAAAIIDKLEAWPSTVAVGWTTGYSIDRAVRIAGAGMRNGGNVDREKVSAAIGAALAKHFDATFDSATWDPVTAELTLKLTRASRVVPGVGLTDVIEVMAVVGPLRLGSNEWLVVRVGSTNVNTVDDGPEPRLR
jgi:hypothetical protein